MRLVSGFKQTRSEWMKDISYGGTGTSKRRVDYNQKRKNRAARRALKLERRKLRLLGRKYNGDLI